MTHLTPSLILLRLVLCVFGQSSYQVNTPTKAYFNVYHLQNAFTNVFMCLWSHPALVSCFQEFCALDLSPLRLLFTCLCLDQVQVQMPNFKTKIIIIVNWPGVDCQALLQLRWGSTPIGLPPSELSNLGLLGRADAQH